MNVISGLKRNFSFDLSWELLSDYKAQAFNQRNGLIWKPTDLLSFADWYKLKLVLRRKKCEIFSKSLNLVQKSVVLLNCSQIINHQPFLRLPFKLVHTYFKH